MKLKRRVQSSQAIALREVIVIVGILFLIAGFVLPRLARLNSRSARISCINNLKQIGVAYRIWASDNSTAFPWYSPIQLGGMQELVTNLGASGRYAFIPFGIMANELGQAPKIVLCPNDTRSFAANFDFILPGVLTNRVYTNENAFGNSNVSYFTGLASEAFDPNAILAGDRNLGNGGYRNEQGAIQYQQDNDFGISGPDDIPANQTGADATINTNGTWFSAKTVRGGTPINSGKELVGWSAQMHSKKDGHGAGNILLGDGSAYQLSSDGLREKLKTAAPHDTNGLVPTGMIRFLFP